MFWNGGEATGFTGEGNFVCNRGGGTGGMTWRIVNATNTAASPTMTYSWDGVLAVQAVSSVSATIGTLTVTNEINSQLPVRGIRCRTGVNGAYTGNSYNYNWTGSAVDAYIGATYIGSLTLFQSDYRLKKYVKTLSDKREMAEGALPSKFLDRIDSYRIVTYQRKVFGDVFTGDGTVYQGLIAHEAKEVNPLAASGEKDGVDENGNARIQQLDPMALITDLMGAVKELRAEVIALKASMQSPPEQVAA